MVVGLDEVGRGAWAGPVVVGAVIRPASPELFVAKLLQQTKLKTLKDSKKLSKAQRETVSDYLENQVEWAVGQAEAAEIDQLGLTEAIRRAAGRALDGLSAKPSQIQADAGLRHPYERQITTNWTIKGDETILEITLASIMAKVYRDRLLQKLDGQYPVYGLAQHVGYGTARHREAIITYGPSDQHRRLFLRKLAGG